MPSTSGWAAANLTGRRRAPEMHGAFRPARCRGQDAGHWRLPTHSPAPARQLPRCSDTPPDGTGGEQPLPAPRITIAYVGAHARSHARPHRRRRRRDVHRRRAPVRLGRGAGAQGALDAAGLRQGRRRRRARPARLRRRRDRGRARDDRCDERGAREARRADRDRHDPGLSRRARAAPDADAAPVRLLLEEAAAARPAPAALRGRRADVG